MKLATLEQQKEFYETIPGVKVTKEIGIGKGYKVSFTYENKNYTIELYANGRPDLGSIEPFPAPTELVMGITKRWNEYADKYGWPTSWKFSSRQKRIVRRAQVRVTLAQVQNEINDFVQWIKNRGVRLLKNDLFEKLVTEYGKLDSDFILDYWVEIQDALHKAGIGTDWKNEVRSSRQDRIAKRETRKSTHPFVPVSQIDTKEYDDYIQKVVDFIDAKIDARLKKYVGADKKMIENDITDEDLVRRTVGDYYEYDEPIEKAQQELLDEILRLYRGQAGAM